MNKNKAKNKMFQIFYSYNVNKILKIMKITK